MCKIGSKDLKGVIEGVLYFLELKRNLFRIGQAVDKGIDTTHTKEWYLMIKNGSLIMVGVRK